MIRFRKLDIAAARGWMAEHQRAAGHGTYHLRVWTEEEVHREALTGELRAYFSEALDDARRALRNGFTDALSPFNEPALDPAANYPAMLHRITLQGYLGETFGALAVEHWDIHGRNDWSAPALLFRFHTSEFQHLEQINQNLRDGQPHERDAVAQRRVGRTGDDALAFVKNGNNEITHILAIEAKCLTTHQAAKLSEAHEKLSNGPSVPVGVRELIDLLADYQTPEAAQWREALIRYRSSAGRGVTRHDGVVYISANRPQRGGASSWMSSNTPNASYTAARPLVGLEYHISGLDTLVEALYR